MQLQSVMAITPTNHNTILKCCNITLLLQRQITHIATHLVCCIIGTYCNHFTERLQYDPHMATKLVVLQSCGMALEVNPCSESTSLNSEIGKGICLM